MHHVEISGANRFDIALVQEGVREVLLHGILYKHVARERAVEKAGWLGVPVIDKTEASSPNP